MSSADAILLAVLQGVAEFLPVSSSGHLVLFQHWLSGGRDVDLLYDVMLHLATTVAVATYFRRDLWSLLRGVTAHEGGSGALFTGCERRMVAYVALASLPTALLGLTIHRWLLPLVMRTDVVGVMLICTGVLLWLGRGAKANRSAAAMRFHDALLIGLLQGIGALPGISRSGITIVGGLVLGLDRGLAVAFSLFISIPAVVGAALIEGFGVGDFSRLLSVPYLTGWAVATVIGYGAIGVLVRLVRRERFHLFAFYLWPLGAAAVVWSHWG